MAETVAPRLNEYDLVELWEALDEIPEAPCEASPLRHHGQPCSGPATHSLRTCTHSFLVCDLVAKRVRAAMDAGSRCDAHRDPIARVWRLIPV